MLKLIDPFALLEERTVEEEQRLHLIKFPVKPTEEPKRFRDRYIDYQPECKLRIYREEH